MPAAGEIFFLRFSSVNTTTLTIFYQIFMIGTSISHQVMMKNVQYIQENSLTLRENSLRRRNHPNLLTPLLDPIFRKRIVRLCMGSYLPGLMLLGQI